MREIRSRTIEESNHKKRARWIANVAVAQGKLTRKECEICGEVEGVEKHHPDYSQPLLVVFVCRKHHKIVDKLQCLRTPSLRTAHRVEYVAPPANKY
jgi:hypothetical protein